MSDKKYGGRYTLAELRYQVEFGAWAMSRDILRDLFDAAERAEQAGHSRCYCYSCTDGREWCSYCGAEWPCASAPRAGEDKEWHDPETCSECGENGCSCGGIPEHGGHGHEFSDSCTCCRDDCDGSGVVGGRRKQPRAGEGDRNDICVCSDPRWMHRPTCGYERSDGMQCACSNFVQKEIKGE